MSRYESIIFLIVLSIALLGLILSASFTGNQVSYLPGLQKQFLERTCPISVEIREYSPKSSLFKNPLITGYSTVNSCQDSGKYAIKINEKTLQKYFCRDETTIEFKSCGKDKILLNGVLSQIQLDDNDLTDDNYYVGKWRCPKGQICIVEKRGNELFKGCESKKEESKKELKEGPKLEVLLRECDLEITYTDHKTEISAEAESGQGRIIIQLKSSDSEQFEDIELTEKSPGFYSTNLVFREKGEMELKYQNYILPLEVMPIPENIRNQKIKKIHKSTLENIKNFFMKVI